MIRRVSCALVLVVAASVGQVDLTRAAVPAGPRLTYIQETFGFPRSTHISPNDLIKIDLESSGPLGEEPTPILGSTVHSPVVPTGSIGWSPDGSTIAFGGVPGAAALFKQPSREDIYLVAGDGSGLVRLTHLGNAVDPVFSPDGKTLYFARVQTGNLAKLILGGTRHGSHKTRKPRHLVNPSSTIWAVGADGTGLRQLTPHRKNVLEFPGSVSPLTGDLVFTHEACHAVFRCKGSIRVLSPGTGAESLLRAGAVSPAYSPDGSRVAFASYRHHKGSKGIFGLPVGDLYVLDLATGAVQQLTSTPSTYEGDPAWDPSGQRLVFGQFKLSGSSLAEINADGSCLTRVSAAPKSGLLSPTYSSPAFEPGPGRDAGRIPC